MLTDAAGREVLGGGGMLPVEVHALGDELRRLWASAGERAGEGTSAVIRACSRNLVVLCPDAETVARVSAVVAGVADRYPSRAFLVCAADGPPDRIEATLTAQCLRREDGRHVCCEQVTLEVGAAAGRRAASAIVPLLVPDLPVFVWVVGVPDWDDELLARLLDVADRLLVDSRATPDPAAMLLDLSHRERGDRWSPADFEWARLADWREAVASLFEDPAVAAQPARVARVSVACGVSGAAAGALLAGWILDRVDAAREREALGLAGRVDSGDAAGEEPPVAVHLEVVADGPGVRRVRLELSGGGTLEAERHGEEPVVRLRVAAPEACTLPAHPPCEQAPAERLLEDLLAELAADPLYEHALARAATLLGGASPD